MKKTFLKIIISAILVFALAIPVYADVGYYSSYSGGSSGSSSSSSSSSSDWGSSSSSSYSWRDSSHKSSSSNSNSKESNPFFNIMFMIYCLLIMIMLIKEYSNTYGVKPRRNITNDGIKNIDLIDNTEIVEKQIKIIDPMFSAEEFLEWGKEVFVKLQNAWMYKKWEEIRPLESQELFEQHKQQLQYLIDNNQMNVIEEIGINKAFLKSFKEAGDKELLAITIEVEMKDYTVDEQTKEVVQGNPNEKITMLYSLTFIRKAGVKSKEQESDITCPNCGAKVQITSSGKCEYCGSVVTTGKHGWVLAQLEGVKRR